jgi:hypothetical protein
MQDELVRGKGRGAWRKSPEERRHTHYAHVQDVGDRGGGPRRGVQSLHEGGAAVVLSLGVVGTGAKMERARKRKEGHRKGNEHCGV